MVGNDNGPGDDRLGRIAPGVGGPPQLEHPRGANLIEPVPIICAAAWRHAFRVAQARDARFEGLETRRMLRTIEHKPRMSHAP